MKRLCNSVSGTTVMRKRWMLAALFLLLLASVGIWLAQDPINKSNFDRIRVGMTEAEVECLLGGPAGDYRTRPTYGATPYKVLGDKRKGGWKSWLGNSLFICVSLDADLRVVGADALEVWHPQESLAKTMGRWLRL